MRNIDSLKNYSEFQRVYNQHDSLSDRYLIVYKAEGSGKVGIVCSKKVGNSIVRHRMTRVIREAYRLNKEQFKSDKDIVIIARELAKEQGFTVIERSLLNILKRHSVLKKEN